VTKFNCRVVRATWDNKLFRYDLEIEDLENGETFHDYAEVLINATGWLKYTSLISN
jgi:glycerol-3-phosphate dehydrogenase